MNFYSDKKRNSFKENSIAINEQTNSTKITIKDT
jgi:hypothetical protein